MKTLVVYTSQTGFTKRYAQWLAEKMDADIYDLKEVQNVLTDEQKSYIKAFYCQGGFNHEKMNLPSKLAMKAFIATLRKSKNEKEREVASFIDHSYDISDIKFIDPVVAYLKGGNAA